MFSKNLKVGGDLISCPNKENYIRKSSELIAESLGLLTNDELGVIRGLLQQAGEGVDKRSHVKSVLHILDGVAENMILINKIEGNYLK